MALTRRFESLCKKHSVRVIKTPKKINLESPRVGENQ